MRKFLKKFSSPVFWAGYCAVFAAWDVVLGVQTGDWWDYPLAVLMAAGVVLNIHLFKQERKAASAVAKKDVSISIPIYHSPGGYITSGGALRRSMTVHTSSTTPTPAPGKTPGEFKGLPFDFAIGEVYGLRMWRMDTYGRLRARNWDKAPPWRPGVNVAKCVEKSDDDWYAAFNRQISSIYSNSTITPPKPAPKPPHDTPSEDCACGFYAYTESHHAETLPYKDSHVVLGVIKGTGRTLMGTKGFRCEKAEIVAFRDPTRGGTKNDPWRVEQLANLKRVYPDVPILESRAALLEFAPLTNTLPDPSTDEFWDLP